MDSLESIRMKKFLDIRVKVVYLNIKGIIIVIGNKIRRVTRVPGPRDLELLLDALCVPRDKIDRQPAKVLLDFHIQKKKAGKQQARISSHSRKSQSFVKFPYLSEFSDLEPTACRESLIPLEESPCDSIVSVHILTLQFFPPKSLWPFTQIFQRLLDTESRVTPITGNLNAIMAPSVKWEFKEARGYMESCCKASPVGLQVMS